MLILELNAEELSLLKQCVALVLGEVFENEVATISISNVLKSDTRKLEVLTQI
jgi:hypothetical protein